MALPATDTFTDTNGNPLSGNWAVEIGGWQHLSNTVIGNGITFSIARWTADTFADNHYAEVAAHYGAGNASGPAVRVDADGNCYVISAFDTGTNTADINIITGGSNTGIGVPFAVNSGDILRLEAIGSTLKAYKNGVLQDTVVDGTYTTGSAGIFAYLSGGVDDFQADNVASGNPWYYFSQQ
jgi:hypothetical protein